MDRNHKFIVYNLVGFKVALHPEGVDRNKNQDKNKIFLKKSPSTRRAWIEILKRGRKSPSNPVALHPEGVDRNDVVAHLIGYNGVALHPEGVDRNIRYFARVVMEQDVALHPEGVDRN